MGIGSWGSFLDKLISKLPIQDRKERIKNKIDDLERKQKELKNGEWTPKKATDYDRNNAELLRLREQLQNLT